MKNLNGCNFGGSSVTKIMTIESSAEHLHKDESGLEASISRWEDLVESSSIDRATKDKLFAIIRDAGVVIGKPGRGATMDKIGERLVTAKFVYETSHGQKESEEMSTLVLMLTEDINKEHRRILSEKY